MWSRERNGKRSMRKDHIYALQGAGKWRRCFSFIFPHSIKGKNNKQKIIIETGKKDGTLPEYQKSLVVKF